MENSCIKHLRHVQKAEQAHLSRALKLGKRVRSGHEPNQSSYMTRCHRGAFPSFPTPFYMVWYRIPCCGYYLLAYVTVDLAVDIIDLASPRGFWCRWWHQNGTCRIKPGPVDIEWIWLSHQWFQQKYPQVLIDVDGANVATLVPGFGGLYSALTFPYKISLLRMVTMIKWLVVQPSCLCFDQSSFNFGGCSSLFLESSYIENILVTLVSSTPKCRTW